MLIIKSHASNGELVESCFLPPLGLMTIGTIMELNGYEVKVIDFSLNFITSKELIKEIKDYEPVYVGISSYTENIDEILSLCKYIKKKLPDVPILLGGVHPTVDTEYCEKKKYVDFIVIGEGEATNLEVAEAIRTKEKLIQYKDIPGLVYFSKEENKFIHNERRQVTSDLDLLPIIKRQYLSKSLQAPMVTVLSSRGCPGSCIYCAASQLAGSKYRVRKIENVFLETILLLHLTDFKKEIYYCDDTFTAVVRRVKRFLELIDLSSLHYKWRCESRVDVLNANRYLIKEMAERGCQRLQYGIESGNQEVLDKIYKHLDLSVVEDLIAYSISCGLRIATSFILGHYCDTKETMNDTLELMRRLKERHGKSIEIFYSYNTPFPGTYQYDHREELGIRILVSNYSELSMLGPVAETDQFTREELYDIGKKAQSLMS